MSTRPTPQRARADANRLAAILAVGRQTGVFGGIQLPADSTDTSKVDCHAQVEMAGLVRGEGGLLVRARGGVVDFVKITFKSAAYYNGNPVGMSRDAEATIARLCLIGSLALWKDLILANAFITLGWYGIPDRLVTEIDRSLENVLVKRDQYSSAASISATIVLEAYRFPTLDLDGVAPENAHVLPKENRELHTALYDAMKESNVRFSSFCAKGEMIEMAFNAQAGEFVEEHGGSKTNVARLLEMQM